ncbi:hypothetical protein CFC21_016780 [Triticum aestivum]|uniref:Uncharacterized protein n=2 Tax=Triticum aestivum TaxID=4565 RepID=A0A3B6AXL1_WHEAT|nr:hypothetical protein CFC21_016780 [Triticum aestivum]
MGRLVKDFGKGTSAACVEDCDDSDGGPFVPNDFAEDDPFQASEEGQMDDPDFDKALYEFYVSHKVNCLKRKIRNVGARNVKCKRSSDFPVANTFTRYSSCSPLLLVACLLGKSVFFRVIGQIAFSNM